MDILARDCPIAAPRARRRRCTPSPGGGAGHGGVAHASAAVLACWSCVPGRRRCSSRRGRRVVAGLLRVDALTAFMLIVIGAVAVLAAVATPAHLAAEIDARGRRPHRRLARGAGAAVPGRDGPGRAGRRPRGAVGRGGGDHDRHRVPGRAAPHPRRGGGRVEVRRDLLGRHRAGAAGDRAPATPPTHAGTGAGLDLVALIADAAAARPGAGHASPSALLIVGFGTKAGPRAAARLAARRAQPGPRPGLRR